MAKDSKSALYSPTGYSLVDKLSSEPAAEDVYGDRFVEHAYIPAKPADVLKALIDIKSFRSRQAFSEITRKFDWFIWRKVFVSSNSPDFTLFWPVVGDTEMLKALSVRLRCSVRWMYADEPSRSWAYLEYDQGNLVQRILDPEQVWSSGVTNGDFLVGRGPRRFEDMNAFLAEIKAQYEPRDMVWNFPKWNFPELREEAIPLPSTDYHWAVEIDFTDGNPVVAYHGNVPKAYRDATAVVGKERKRIKTADMAVEFLRTRAQVAGMGDPSSGEIIAGWKETIEYLAAHPDDRSVPLLIAAARDWRDDAYPSLAEVLRQHSRHLVESAIVAALESDDPSIRIKALGLSVYLPPKRRFLQEYMKAIASANRDERLWGICGLTDIATRRELPPVMKALALEEDLELRGAMEQMIRSVTDPAGE